jgi:hypothetical protein
MDVWRVTRIFCKSFQINQGLITEEDFTTVEKIEHAIQWMTLCLYNNECKCIDGRPYKRRVLNVYEKTLIECVSILLLEKK